MWMQKIFHVMQTSISINLVPNLVSALLLSQVLQVKTTTF